MRSIKFRAWDIESPAMLTWEEIQDQWDSEGYHPAMLSNDHYHCMQFTGLHDKNGKEIYSGDILRVVYGIPATSSILEVEWKTGQQKDCHERCQYGLNNEITGWWYKDHSNGHDCPMFISEDFEIIGNIHENPEMTK